MKTKTKQELVYKKKDGSTHVIPKDVECSVQPSNIIDRALVEADGHKVIVRYQNLHLYFAEFSECPELPDDSGDEDVLCNTPAGHFVEPDGHDEHGFPSWMLILGFI